MVRMRRVPLGLIVPALLIGLVGLLATLQYRWLGKVSEAEREQLRRSLEQRARVFGEDFDAEVSRLYLALQPSATAAEGDDGPLLAGAWRRWREGARFPGMVRGVYLVAEGVAGVRSLRRYDTDGARFGPATTEWPAHLEAVRARLTVAVLPGLSSGTSGARVVSISAAPVIADAPALLIPVSRAPLPVLPALPAAPQGDAERNAGRVVLKAPFFLQTPGAYLLVDLDGDYIRRAMLPALVTAHFPEHGNEGYGLTVLSAAGTPLLVAGAAVRDPAKGDVTVPFFVLRLDVVRQIVSAVRADAGRGAADAPGDGKPAGASAPGEGQRVAVMFEHRTADGSGRAGAVTGQVRIQQSGWTLVLRHPAGSVDAAVLQARRRNLWLSFGILGVLAAGLVLVVVNGRRTAQLAARQMDFVASVSHELRTPLAVIRSAAQNLSAGVVANAGQARRYGQLIEDEGRRLTDMVEQILEYSRIHGDRPLRNPRPLDVRQLLAEVATSFEGLAADAGVTLEFEAAPEDLPAVVGDEAALRRALHNLVGNALKYASSGGWIGLSASAGQARRGNGEVRITVADRGPGIAAADLAHVYEPFYRGQLATERQVHGNGLGLTLVKRIAEVHGGTVTVKSAPGEGSAFTLHLPAATRTAGEGVTEAADTVRSHA